MSNRGRPSKNALTRYPNRIREVRRRRGWSQDIVAERAEHRLSQQTIGKLERGELRLKQDQMEILARALMVDPAELLPGADSRRVPVVGYVGGGAQVYPVDAYAKGQGLDETSCPPNLDPRKTVAVVVKGDSMFPLTDGWLLFYSRAHERAAADLVGKVCIVKVAGDGPTLVKQVRRGPTPGKFNLISANAPMMEDVELEWASPVLSMLPPDV